MKSVASYKDVMMLSKCFLKIQKHMENKNIYTDLIKKKEAVVFFHPNLYFVNKQL